MEVGHDLQNPADTIPYEVTWRRRFDIIILILGNFLNYTDRYTLAGVLLDVQKHFNLDNENGGLIQTIYVLVYTIIAPVYGYLGDRYNRTFLLAYSLLVWNASSLGSSFVDQFWAFLLLRGAFGLGQSAFVTVAPTIIGDLVTGPVRSRILVCFYLAIPMGSGLGYTIGAQMTDRYGSWVWSLRATPAPALLVMLLILLVMKEPYRGLSEGKQHMPRGSVWEDIKYLLRVKSYVHCTLAFTAVAFSSGAICWWTPKMIIMGLSANNQTDVKSHQVGSTFGIVTTVAGGMGLCLGYVATFKTRNYCPRIDPIVCGIGCVVAVPLLVASAFVENMQMIWCYVLLFFGLMALNVNWALICDVILQVTVPAKRSMAVGLQLLIGHSLGDAGSPYLLGLLADKVHQWSKGGDDNYNEFVGLRSAFFVACGVALVGALFFFLNAVYIERDSAKADRGSLSGSLTRPPAPAPSVTT